MRGDDSNSRNAASAKTLADAARGSGRTEQDDRMAKLIYSAVASLDQYVEDEHGRFDWAAPDEELHAFVNALERPTGTYVYGRRMYETMVYWETAGEGQPEVISEYAAVWRAADKIVYSRTLESTQTAKTRLERELDPDAIRALKRSAESDRLDPGCD
jgi:dihydrofolate reductase